MEAIYTPNAPEAIGPYSQAMRIGNLVFTSGQIPINPATGNVEAVTIEEQAEQVCKNLAAVLTAAGKRWSKPPVSSVIWEISPLSTAYTPNTSPENPPVPVWQSRPCPRTYW